MVILSVVQFFMLFWNLAVSSLGEFRIKSYSRSKFRKVLSKVRFLKIQFFITRKRGSSGLCWDQKSIQNYWFMGGCFSTKFRGICRGTRYRNFIVVQTAVLVLSWFRNDGNFLSCLGFLVFSSSAKFGIFNVYWNHFDLHGFYLVQTLQNLVLHEL